MVTLCEMKRPIIFIVGLQKSGTTLMLRILKQSDLVEIPFKAEGNDFWGNMPPFDPCEFPAGVIYQRTGGEMGHEIDEDDATREIHKTLHDRLAGIVTGCPIVANKNPYNTVRLPWIRKLFPDSMIIVMVRRPIPNVFSLLKKYIPHEGGGLAPKEGWWGVKPKGWRRIVNEDKVIQCATQWKMVNEKLWHDKAHIDMIVTYHDLCASPTEVLNKVLATALDRAFEADVTLPRIQCFDSEYKHGSRLLSKNKYYRASGSLVTGATEPVEIGPLKEEDIAVIEKICGETQSMIEGLQ
jgi:hypothetical protein